MAVKSSTDFNQCAWVVRALKCRCPVISVATPGNQVTGSIVWPPGLTSLVAWAVTGTSILNSLCVCCCARALSLPHQITDAHPSSVGFVLGRFINQNHLFCLLLKPPSEVLKNSRCLCPWDLLQFNDTYPINGSNATCQLYFQLDLLSDTSKSVDLTVIKRIFFKLGRAELSDFVLW